MYLKCQSDKFRKATIVFYALCLLYILSTATVVSDLVVITIQVQLEYKLNGLVNELDVSYDSIC